MGSFVNLNDVYFPIAGGKISGNVKVEGSLTADDISDSTVSTYDVGKKITELSNAISKATLDIEKLYIGLGSNSAYEKDGWLIVPMGKYVQISRNVTDYNVAITQPWGNGIYESTDSYGNLDFPFEFEEVPVMNLFVVGTDGYAVMGIQPPYGTYSTSKVNTGSWYYYRPDDKAKRSTVTTSIVVVGKIANDKYDKLIKEQEDLIRELKEQLEELRKELEKES